MLLGSFHFKFELLLFLARPQFLGRPLTATRRPGGAESFGGAVENLSELADNLSLEQTATGIGGFSRAALPAAHG
jgi:hypothetical protein